mmetsp:Transcript_10450/g.16189  ORF Transcript_10450/g.16189 Transcript_10450/m.16189 type:complete len:247 (-) Transcript_10450:226-966(-)
MGQPICLLERCITTFRKIRAIEILREVALNYCIAMMSLPAEFSKWFQSCTAALVSEDFSCCRESRKIAYTFHHSKLNRHLHSINMNEQSKANEWEFWDFDVSASSALYDSPTADKKLNSSKDCSCSKDGPSVDCEISHILPSHVNLEESSTYEEDDVDKAWREFDSYESILSSPTISNQSHAGIAQQVTHDEKTKSQATTKIQGTTKSATIRVGRNKSLDLSLSRDKSLSPKLNDVKSNCKGARAA